MKLATVRADGRTALAGLTDAGVLDLSGALPGAGDLDSVDALCAALAVPARRPNGGPKAAGRLDGRVRPALGHRGGAAARAAAAAGKGHLRRPQLP